MNLPGFGALSSAWLFLLLVPLILVYFLKLRRPRLEVSSLALWRQVLNDQRVNSPFQKFKRNLLLLLQVLLLSALILAAMQPYWPSGIETAQSIPVLIDVSASMAAHDQPGGISRLEAARAKVRQLIDNLLPNQRLCLIAVDSTARRLTDFTNNQRILREALNSLTVRPVSSRLEDGLQMAQALARTTPVPSVVLLTDGNVLQQIDFELPFTLNYQQLSPAGPNVGITECNARRSTTGWNVFVRLEASARASPPQPTQLIEVALYENDVRLQQESVSITAGDVSRVTFALETDAQSTLEVRLLPTAFDSLALDNSATLVLPTPRPLKVFCPPNLEAYRHALEAIPEIELFPQEGTATPQTVDLCLTEGGASPISSARVTLHIARVPSDLAALVKVETNLAQVIDWNRSAPLLQHVQLLDVQIADDPVSQPGVGDRDYELAGYEILAQGSHGPLILQKSTAADLHLYLLFHTDRSSLPYRVGFPILVANLVQLASDRSELGTARAWPTGILPARVLEPETEYRIQTPAGQTATVRSSPSGLLSGIPADHPGTYTIRKRATVVETLGTGLLSSSETGLKTVDRLLFPETSVTTATQSLASDRPLWVWFALAGLGLLLGEWWYFQRRAG